MPKPRVSVVIPTLNEATTIAPCLDQLAAQKPFEIIVADADSPDGTAAIAKECGARVVRSPRGRGVQQNLGASATSGDVLLFLHADCRLELGGIEAIRRLVGRSPSIPGGCFRMRVDAADRRYRAIDAAAHLRAGLFEIPYGDQGLFVTRSAFDRVGGFPEVPLMEDVLIALRLRRLGRLALLPRSILVSDRRWRRYGIVGQSLRNWTLTAAAVVGVDSATLSRYYPVVR